MTQTVARRRAAAIAASTMLCVAGCSFEGANSLPLPGTVGGGTGSTTLRVELANVGTLEPNSPVMIDDVVVGSVRTVRVSGRHAEVHVSVKPGVVVPANAVAAVGQTSLLGSMHLQLGPPLGQPPVGALESDATIPLDRSATYPSTEQTLASLSVVANAGGLGQIGDIIHSFNAAFSGRQGDLRELLGQLDEFVGTLNDQRDNVLATVTELDRLSSTLAGQQETITRALREIPPALDVLLRERPRLVAALDKLRVFSDTATGVVSATKDDLVRNLQNLEPTIRALADVGPDISTALAFATVFPLGQNLIDRGIRGDYMNLFVTIDLTRERLKRGLLAGTRFGDENIELVPAPGDRGYNDYYTRNPMGVGIAPPASAPPPPSPTTPPPPAAGPLPSEGGG
jgi:virulence factor Mce-like protein